MGFNPAETEVFVLGCAGVCLLNSPSNTESFFSVAVQHAELYLDLLFLWLNSLLQVSAFGREWDNTCMGLVQVLCSWSAQAVSH